MRKAENVLERKDVLAPVSGTVVRLYYHTAGGVIETGRAIAEILPNDAPLIIETLVPRSDIDTVKIGQNSTVRLIGLNQRTTPILNGTVEYVSADAVAQAAKKLDRARGLCRAGIDDRRRTCARAALCAKARYAGRDHDQDRGENLRAIYREAYRRQHVSSLPRAIRLHCGSGLAPGPHPVRPRATASAPLLAATCPPSLARSPPEARFSTGRAG